MTKDAAIIIIVGVLIIVTLVSFHY